ncbi:hypothetical protein, partial [Yersinia pseudotuberculosis]|uniref:hypothetical protein n=1 Tax=Yersinia pseudotuberculosis TaxID=633 RepID=UPI001C62496B
RQAVEAMLVVALSRVPHVVSQSHLHPSSIPSLQSPTSQHLSPVTCHLSPVTCHLSPVTCHLSPVTCHLSP